MAEEPRAQHGPASRIPRNGGPGRGQGWLTLPIRRLAKRDLRQTTTPDPAASRPAPRVEAAQLGAGVAPQLRRLPVAVRGRELLLRSLRSQLKWSLSSSPQRWHSLAMLSWPW